MDTGRGFTEIGYVPKSRVIFKKNRWCPFFSSLFYNILFTLIYDFEKKVGLLTDGDTSKSHDSPLRTIDLPIFTKGQYAKYGLLGRDWFYKFIVDNPFMSDQLSSNPVEIARVQSCTVPRIAYTYDLCEQLERKLGLREKPERKANYDQTDISFVKSTSTKSRRKRFVGSKHTSSSQESVHTNNIIPASTPHISYSEWVLENGYWRAGLILLVGTYSWLILVFFGPTNLFLLLLVLVALTKDISVWS